MAIPKIAEDDLNEALTEAKATAYTEGANAERKKFEKALRELEQISLVEKDSAIYKNWRLKDQDTFLARNNQICKRVHDNLRRCVRSEDFQPKEDPDTLRLIGRCVRIFQKYDTMGAYVDLLETPSPDAKQEGE